MCAIVAPKLRSQHNVVFQCAFHVVWAAKLPVGREVGVMVLRQPELGVNETETRLRIAGSLTIITNPWYN